jgi:hypothetical protein
MSQLIDLLSGDIAADKVNKLFEIASESNLNILSPEQLNGLEQIIITHMLLSDDPSSGAVIYNPTNVEELLVRVRGLQ